MAETDETGTNNSTNPNEAVVGVVATTDAGFHPDVRNVIAYVRAFMRDYPELNRLIEGYETSDRLIALCIMDTIDDYNTTPPLLDGVGVGSFPSVSLLIRGTVIRVLESVGILQTRNHMTYSDGQGIQVTTSDKGPQLMGWINLFSRQYESQKTRLKIAININGALNRSAVPSEYRYVNGSYDEIL